MLYNADANTQVDNVADLEKLVVASRDKAVVRLRDIAKVSLEKNHDTYRAIVAAHDPRKEAAVYELAVRLTEEQGVLAAEIRVLKGDQEIHSLKAKAVQP